ncbi:MAG: hypothetical protein EAX91_14485 [Candidatus Lokiarchaeota archaeon]|nr:hypothetical protein [Candidatus Lokiarchaeota archaeon]
MRSLSSLLSFSNLCIFFSTFFKCGAAEGIVLMIIALSISTKVASSGSSFIIEMISSFTIAILIQLLFFNFLINFICFFVKFAIYEGGFALILYLTPPFELKFERI